MKNVEFPISFYPFLFQTNELVVSRNTLLDTCLWKRAVALRVKVRLFFPDEWDGGTNKKCNLVLSFSRFHGVSYIVFIMRGLRSRMQGCVCFFVPSLSGSACVRCSISTIDPCGASQCIVGECSSYGLSDVWIQNFWARAATRYCVDAKQFSHFSCWR